MEEIKIMAVDGYPLEDQDGYVKCDFYEGVCGNGIFRSAVTLRGAGSCECIQQEVGDNMGSKRQSKSLERLSALSIRPSSAGEASSSSGSLNSNASQSQMRQEFARPAPRIPPRPDVLVLSRFQQQRQLLGRALRPPSSPRAEPGQTPRRKYVELEVLPPKRDGKLEAGGTSRSAPQQTQSKHLSPRAARTSYAVLCIEDDATKDPRKRSQGANRRQRDRAPVRRSKSSSGDQPTPPGSRGYNMYTHARNSSALPADHLQQQNHLDPAETPKTRKPRKVSTPVITTTTTTTASVGHFPPLSVKAASVDTSSSSAATLEVGVDTRLKATSHTISAPTLHTSHGVLRTSSENLRSEEDSASSAKRPPPPNRKPPVRPRGPPVPRPRKPRTNPETNDPDYVHMMSSSAHGTLATISTTPGSSSSLHSLHSQSSSTTNTTPLPQVSAGQVRGEKGEGNGSPLDTDEEDGPYTYIDLTKNRHLMSHGSSAGTDLQKQSGPLPVYTPLNFPASDDVPNGDQCAAGGGVYMSPDMNELNSMTPQVIAGECDGENPVVNDGDSEKEKLIAEPLYTMPGDQVYYNDEGAAIPLATPDTYAPLTTVTKLEDAVYTVCRSCPPSPSPLSASS